MLFRRISTTLLVTVFGVAGPTASSRLAGLLGPLLCVSSGFTSGVLFATTATAGLSLVGVSVSGSRMVVSSVVPGVFSRARAVFFVRRVVV